MTYYALLLPIMCMIWPDCVSENEKKINDRTISDRLGYTWLVHVCALVAEIVFTYQ